MNRQTLIGICFLACFIAACDTTEQDATESTEGRAGPPETELARDETATVETMSRPETLAERRELRLQLAEQQAKYTQERARVQAEQTEPAMGEVPDTILEKIINDHMTKIQEDNFSDLARTREQLNETLDEMLQHLGIETSDDNAEIDRILESLNRRGQSGFIPGVPVP